MERVSHQQNFSFSAVLVTINFFQVFFAKKAANIIWTTFVITSSFHSSWTMSTSKELKWKLTSERGRDGLCCRPRHSSAKLKRATRYTLSCDVQLERRLHSSLDLFHREWKSVNGASLSFVLNSYWQVDSSITGIRIVQIEARRTVASG